MTTIQDVIEQRVTNGIGYARKDHSVYGDSPNDLQQHLAELNGQGLELEVERLNAHTSQPVNYQDAIAQNVTNGRGYSNGPSADKGTELNLQTVLAIADGKGANTLAALYRLPQFLAETEKAMGEPYRLETAEDVDAALRLQRYVEKKVAKAYASGLVTGANPMEEPRGDEFGLIPKESLIDLQKNIYSGLFYGSTFRENFIIKGSLEEILELKEILPKNIRRIKRDSLYELSDVYDQEIRRR